MRYRDCTKDHERRRRENEITRYVWNVPTKTNREKEGGGGRSRVESWVCGDQDVENWWIGTFLVVALLERASARIYPLCHRNTDIYARTRCLYSISLSRGTYKSTGRLSEYFPSNLISSGGERVQYRARYLAHFRERGKRLTWGWITRWLFEGSIRDVGISCRTLECRKGKFFLSRARFIYISFNNNKIFLNRSYFLYYLCLRNNSLWKN